MQGAIKEGAAEQMAKRDTKEEGVAKPKFYRITTKSNFLRVLATQIGRSRVEFA